MFPALSNPLLLRRIGFTLFVLSFLTPNWRFEGFGYQAFFVVPELVWDKFSEGDIFHDWHMILLIGSLSLGWLSNFTVFSSLPFRAAAIAIAAPWILLLVMTFDSNSNGPDTHWLGFIPFYPWAFGIGIIHWSRLIERRHLMTVATTLVQA